MLKGVITTAVSALVLGCPLAWAEESDNRALSPEAKAATERTAELLRRGKADSPEMQAAIQHVKEANKRLAAVGAEVWVYPDVPPDQPPAGRRYRIVQDSQGHTAYILEPACDLTRLSSGTPVTPPAPPKPGFWKTIKNAGMNSNGSSGVEWELQGISRQLMMNGILNGSGSGR